MRTVLTALIVAVAASATPALAQEAEPERPDRKADVVLAVEGFNCEHCTAKLQKRLGELEGMQAVLAAPWEEGTVSIWLMEAAEVDEEALAKAVKESGFVLKEVRRVRTEAEAT